MFDFDVLNKPAEVKLDREKGSRPFGEIKTAEVVEDSFPELREADPFDLDRLLLELEPYRKEIAEMKKTAVEHRITDKESNELASTYGAQAQAILKRINAAANQIKAPYKKIVDGINEAIRPFKSDLQGIKDNLGSKISHYAREQAELERRKREKAAREAAEKARKEAEEKRKADLARQRREREDAQKLQEQMNAEAEAAGVEPVKVDIPDVVDPGVEPIVEQSIEDPKKAIRTEAGTTSIVERWSWSLVDINKVPDDFVERIPNKSAIKEAIDAGVREIEGLRIYPDDSVRFRSK